MYKNVAFSGGHTHSYKIKKEEAEVTSIQLTSNISQSVLLHQWSVECGALSDV